MEPISHLSKDEKMEYQHLVGIYLTHKDNLPKRITMTKPRILELFLQAEKDWGKPFDIDNDNRTQFGLCYYYFEQLDAAELEILRSHWGKYSTVKPKGIDYDFRYLGSNEIGRAERLEAIRKVIKELRNELV